ncbi:MAG: diacylglycerol kinase family lipid kinase [Paludibacteraceae bacterium]|nr:diacylglycerol kinase family lipid kinase [Paludibacteraceae bacterium]
MDKLKIAFIINPHSGTSEKKELPEQINQLINKDKFEVTTIFTEYAGHGKELAAQYAAQGFNAVIACGGDGTVNEIASGLVGTKTAFGIVPFGSGNGLARHLHIPLNVRGAIKTINNYVLQPLDCGVANDQKFFCTCGTGFDAQIAWDFSQQSTRGLRTYLKLILKEFVDYKPKHYIIETESERLEVDAVVVTIANASQYGNDAYIAPQAKTNDGLLDICIIKPFRWYHIPRITAQLMSKHLNRSKLVTMTRAKSITLKRDFSGPFHYDGDPTEFGKEINIQIIPNALKAIGGK